MVQHLGPGSGALQGVRRRPRAHLEAERLPLRVRPAHSECATLFKRAGQWAVSLSPAQTAALLWSIETVPQPGPGAASPPACAPRQRGGHHSLGRARVRA